MNQTNIAMKTMAMKARMANAIRTALYNKPLESISKEEKLRLLDEIHKANHTMHWELIAYKQKRQDKAEVERLRQARGWKPRKKTSKAAYEQMKRVD